MFAHRFALTTTSDPREVDHLRSRVRLYLQVMLIVDLVAYVSDYVTPLFIDDLVWPEHDLVMRLVRHGGTVLIAAAWAFTRFARPGAGVVVALETAATVALSLVYVHVAAESMTAEVAPFAPVFAMFGIMLLLSVRAALVPSPVARTAIVGVAVMACFFVFGWETIRQLEPRVFDGLTFIAGAFVLATSVTSHVIYGLRREVRRALRLGQYTLEGKLGEGGMGEVFRARHAMLRRQAAIKLIKPDPAGDGAERADTLQRFEQEAQVTAQLRSPHTVELYDYGVSDEGAVYYVMELLDGIDLEAAVARYGPMPAGRVIYLLRQVCESLAEAHAAGLVHRDIKPANLVLCRYGLAHDFVKVLDFGLVRLRPRHGGPDPALTAGGFAGGTPAYLAPEMVAGDDPVDARTDLYSLGCVAYWLLAGRPPFERDSVMRTVVAHVNDLPAPLPRDGGTAVSPALDALIMACLEKRPEDRPGSAAELARRLEGVEAELGPENRWDRERARAWWTEHAPGRTEAASSGAVTVTVRPGMRGRDRSG